MEEKNVIELRHISKSFPGIKANDDISLTLRKGEIHALLGENGAGKSTLMSILFGLYEPDEGEIYVNGTLQKIKNPNDATRLGIGMVHQHFKLVECYTALQNIILGYEPTKFGFLNPKVVRKSLEDLCEKFNFEVNLDETIEDMPVGEQQKVEILKMLYRQNDILIFDEPTAVLTPQEIEELMHSMKELVKEGKSILFISHKLNEIMEVSDRVTVLQRGKCLGTLNTKDTNPTELSRLMVGRDVELTVQKDECKPGDTVLSVENITVYNKDKKKDVVHNVSFNVRKGEIVCIAGIEGNGQSDLIYALTGIEKIKNGSAVIKFDANNEDQAKKYIPKANKFTTSLIDGFKYFGGGISFGFKTLGYWLKSACHSIKNLFRKNKKPFEIEKPEFRVSTKANYLEEVQKGRIHLEALSVRKRNESGISHIPEDRHKYGLVLDFNLRDNLVLDTYFHRPFQKFSFINNKEKDKVAARLVTEFDIRSSQGTSTIVRSMSGGNQQKAIVARELDRHTPLLIAVQPTRGLDVGAIESIHKDIIKFRDEGNAVLLVSLELEEVMNLADRILVMYNGEITGQFNPKDVNVNELGLYMSGAKRDSVNAVL